MDAVGGPAAEQIIAGVVLSERLAVTMYGAIHRAQFGGQRNLRGLVVDAKLLAEATFRGALTDPEGVAMATGLDHVNIVPTFAVEQGGPDVVVVTRGVGRYVTVQDLIASARSNRGQSGKLSLHVAGAIGRCVVEALAVAHRANVVHGAVHPRSVLIDEDGAVRLGDFVVGRALTTAVAQGADSSMWRGLAGFLAPELVVGDNPTPASDVFAVGAMMFTMLSGDAPPGTLHVTPAVERLVQRALDTDVSRRYKNASDLLENLLEAFEDDRWEIADRGEVIKAAGLSTTDTNVDEATEDLLASLGALGGAVQVTPMRPSTDIRAEAIAARHTKTPTTGQNRLEALLADLDDGADHTTVEEAGDLQPDPVSELIKIDPRKKEAIVQIKPRVPSLDDPDDPDDLPAPPPARDAAHSARQPNATDEDAALAALKGLDAPVNPPRSSSRGAARPNLSEIPDFEVPPPRVKSRAFGILSLIVAIAGGVGIYYVYKHQEAQTAAAEARARDKKQDAEDKTRLAQAAQADRGSIKVTVTPAEASVWLKLGRTNTDTFALASTQMHRIRIELEGYQAVDTEILAANWSGQGPTRKATVNVTLKAVGKDAKTGRSLAVPLPARPPNLAIDPKDFSPGEGPVHLETSPPGAEVWLLIGYGNTGVAFPTIAGRSYEVRALLDGFKPGYVQVSTEEWRDGGDPNIPIDIASKKLSIDKQIELVADPSYVPEKKPKKGK